MTTPISPSTLPAAGEFPVPPPAPVIPRHQLSTPSERDPSPQFAASCLADMRPRPSLLSLQEKTALLLRAPRLFLEMWQHYFGKPFSEEFPALKECQCSFINADRRSTLEFKTFQQIKSTFQPAEKELTIVSVGCGECYQDLIYMIRCVEAGFNAQFIMIDNDEKKVKQAVANLEEFYRRYLMPFPGAPKISFTLYDSLESYREAVGSGASSKASVVLCIDLQGDQLQIDSVEGPSMAYLHAHCLRFFTSNTLLQRDGLFVYTETYNKDGHDPAGRVQISLHQECQSVGLTIRNADIHECDPYRYYRGAIYQSFRS